MSVTVQRWAVRWHNEAGGEHIIFENTLPMFFNKKSEAQAYIREKYGYIAKRKDLRRPPHNWRMPQPVRVEIRMQEVEP